MRKLVLTMVIAGAAAAAFPGSATAQRWTPIAQRQANLSARIDQGVRSGELTRPEAGRLRAQLRDLAYREDRYRRDGLSVGERRDLQARFDAISGRVYRQKRDWNRR